MEVIKEKFSNKSFKFVGKLNGSESTKVVVAIPDLKDSKLSVWGDWGPMYRFKLGGQDTIKISYDEKVCEVKKSHIEFSSPACANQRSESPLYCHIEDAERGCSFTIYLNSDASLQKVEVESTEVNSWYQNYEEPAATKKVSAYAL